MHRRLMVFGGRAWLAEPVPVQSLAACSGKSIEQGLGAGMPWDKSGVTAAALPERRGAPRHRRLMVSSGCGQLAKPVPVQSWQPSMECELHMDSISSRVCRRQAAPVQSAATPLTASAGGH